MSIFNLNSIVEQVSSDVQTNQAPTDKPEETKTAIVGDQVTTPDSVNKEEQHKEQTIVLDGPLSHIYTQALNLVYAQEDMGITGSLAYQMKLYQDIKGEQVNQEDDSYVYAIHGDSLDSGGLITTVEKMKTASKRYTRKYLCMEDSGKVSSCMGLLYEAAREMKFTVCRDKSSFIQALSKGGKA